MNASKKWLIAAAVLVAAGILICVISFAMLGFSTEKLSTATYVTNTHSLDADFDSIRIDVDTEDVRFEFTNENACTVICREDADNLCDVRTENGALVIDKPNQNHVHFQFGITQDTSVTVRLPKQAYENVTVETDTGDITIADFTASEMQLSSDTGELNLSDLSVSGTLDIREHTGDPTLQRVFCDQLSIRTSTGDVSLTDVVCTGAMNLKTDTGEVTFAESDADSITVKTDTGDVTGSLRSAKIFVTKTDTGKVSVPESSSGGRCEVTTDTGDIRITVQ